MPIAAIPRYLGTNFKSASPALRFGMYLPIWTERADQENEVKERARKGSREGKELKEVLDDQGMDAAIRNLVRREHLPDLWDKNDSGSRASWNKVISLTNDDNDDHARMKALSDREAVLFQTAAGANGLELMAKSIAPFTTGLGNEHPLENGFAFLNPYGLPYLPGSGVKGVVRRAAEELAHRDFFKNESGWTLPAIWHLFGFEPWLVSEARESEAEWKEWIDGFSVTKTEIEEYLNAVLDEHSDAHRKLKSHIRKADDPISALREKHLHVRGALEFWDVVPQIKGNKLAVEIMTPHHSHYYDPNKPHAGSNSPHDSGKPTPISFLTVPPGSDFVFHVRSDHRRLSRCVPELAKDGRWRALLKAAFEHAFEWLGFGAKTSVGYGAMEPDPRVEEAARRKAEEEAAIRARQEEERQRLEAERAAAEQRRAEQAAFDALPRSRRRLIEAERALKVFQESHRFDKSPLLNEVKSHANRLAHEAPEWSDATEREEAARFLEQLYETIGWHDPGMRTKQKKKQEMKRREAIARIRGED